MEVLVSAGIMALLTTMAITVVLACTRYFHRSLTSYYLHQDAIVSLNSLAREISASSLAAVAPGPDGVVFGARALDQSTTPVRQWVGWICYCSMPVKGTPALVRMEEPLNPPSLTLPGAIPAVSYFQSSGLRSKLMAAYLKSFLVTTVSHPRHPKVSIVLELARDNPRRFSVKVSTIVPLSP